MSIRWDDWVHVTFSTYGHWLPGDPRGFHDHGHRIHSSGDYKSPPSRDEHAGLHFHARAMVGGTVEIPDRLKVVVAEALASKLMDIGRPPRILAVVETHVHILLRIGSADAKPVVGRAKQLASHRVRKDLPGTVWAQGCDVVRVRDEDHYREAVKYIADHELEDAYVWVHPVHRTEHEARFTREKP